MNSPCFAAGLMICQASLFAIETAMIHHIGSRVSPILLTLLRSLASLMLVAILARKLGWSVMKTGQGRLQLLRGFVSVLYLFVMMYSFTNLPFGDATAISYTQAIYIVIFSSLILHEPVAMFRWIAASIGVVGAALIIKPAFLDLNISYLVALLGTSLNGLAFVLNKHL